MRVVIGLMCVAMVIGLMGCANGSSPKGQLPEAKTPSMIEPPPAGPNPPIDPVLQNAARQELEAALNASNAVLRTHGIETVQEAMGVAGMNRILKGLGDRNAMVRYGAAMAAGQLRLTAAKDTLLKLVDDENMHVRVASAFALHRLGDTRYSQMLERTLLDPDKGVRGDTAVALGRLGDTTAVRILRPRLSNEPDVAVKLQVAEALWMLGDEQGLNYLVAAAISRFPDDQMVALMALAGPKDPRVIGHIRPALEGDYGEVALVAARALGVIGSADGYGVAIKGAKNTDARQRLLAARALAAIGSPKAQDVLAGLLKDADPEVRLAAAGAVLELRQ